MARTHLNKGDLSTPGQWRLWRSFVVLISCPGCGRRIELSHREFWITDEGIVRPSVDCPEECGFHDYVVLNNYLEV